MKQPLTDERINRLIARREKLTNRRDEHINFPAVDEIDARLREIPAGERPDVDKLLGRASLGPQSAPDDYRIANRPGNPNWHGVKAWFDDAAKQLDSAAAEVGVKAEHLTARQVAQLKAPETNWRDWDDIKGDLDI